MPAVKNLATEVEIRKLGFRERGNADTFSSENLDAALDVAQKLTAVSPAWLSPVLQGGSFSEFSSNHVPVRAPTSRMWMGPPFTYTAARRAC